MSTAKLVLGTAGLGGKPYGSEKRRVSEVDAVKLIRLAYDSGVRRFDTAPAYGDAEERIGNALNGNPAQVWTKTSGDQDIAITSIEKIGISGVHYLWHNWNGETLPNWVCGVTVYANDDRAAPDDVVVQQDWSLLQQDVVKDGTAIIARSVFLQGRLTNTGARTGPVYDRARRMAAIYGVDLTTLALRAALETPNIASVVIGPTSMEELEVCLEIAERPQIKMTRAHLALLACDDPAETDPRRWSTP